MNKLIIFNADDFNLTPGVSRGIVESYKLGVVRSTSIMANLPNFAESAKLLQECPNLDAGVHVNLTYGEPLLDKSMVPSLVDDMGKFWRKPSILSKAADPEDMKREIAAQVNRCLESGLSITHLDTHHHLHQSDPRVLEILIEMALLHKLGIRSTDHAMRDRLKDEGIPTPDNFNEDFYGKDFVNAERLGEIIETAPDGISEIMCHPGFVDDGLMENSSYNHPRELEIQALTHPKTIQALQKQEAKIIGYRDILEFFPGFQKLNH